MSEPPAREPREEDNQDVQLPADSESDSAAVAQPDAEQPVRLTGIDPYGDQPDVPDLGIPQTSWQAPPTPLPPRTFQTDPMADQSTPSWSPQPQASGAITNYQVRSSRTPLIILGAVVLVVLAVLVTWATRPGEPDAPQNAPTPATSAPHSPSATPSGSDSPSADASSSASPTPPPSALAPPNSIPVVYRGFEAQWTITSSSWDSNGLHIQVEITATKGSLDYSFMALETTGSANLFRGAGPVANGRISEGDTVRGQVSFAKPHAETQVMFANSYGRQLAALTVAA